MTATDDVAPAWSHFAHGADIGVRGIGASVAAAFEQAALALTAIAIEPETIIPRRSVIIDCRAPDLEILLVDWLNALIAKTATERLLFTTFKVRIDAATGGWRLSARASGEPIDMSRHDLAVEAKGATMTSLKVCQRADGCWLAQCVVDV